MDIITLLMRLLGQMRSFQTKRRPNCDKLFSVEKIIVANQAISLPWRPAKYNSNGKTLYRPQLNHIFITYLRYLLSAARIRKTRKNRKELRGKANKILLAEFEYKRWRSTMSIVIIAVMLRRWLASIWVAHKKRLCIAWTIALILTHLGALLPLETTASKKILISDALFVYIGKHPFCPFFSYLYIWCKDFHNCPLSTLGLGCPIYIRMIKDTAMFQWNDTPCVCRL